MTITLTYSADFARAEYHDGSLIWSPVHPLPPMHPDTPQEQLPSPPHDLRLIRGTRYRAPSRLLSHIPPFATSLLRVAPAPLALELGLCAIDYAEDGFIYLAAASHSLYLRKDTTLLIATHTISDASAVEGATMALRRAGMAPQAEALVLAAEASKSRCLEHLRNIIRKDAPNYLDRRPPTPPDQLDPARGLLEVLEQAQRILRGEGL